MFGAFAKDALMLECGGRRLMMGGEGAWNFGWRKSDEATTAALGLLDSDPDDGAEEIPGDFVMLTEFARKANGGKLPPFSYQLTGSCVNSGMWNADLVKSCVDIVRGPVVSAFKLPFTLATYGYSRHLIGDESEGEGSMGDSMAKARLEFGRVFIDHPSAPKPTIYDNAVCYSKQIELKYSAARNCPPDLRADAAKLTSGYINVTNSKDAVAQLRRGRPLTFAGSWGGLMQCELKGTPQVLMNRHADRWDHQQSCLGFFFHPTLGLLFWIQNNWYMIQSGSALSVHGQTTLGCPPGGYFITEDDFNLQCRGGEIRALKFSIWETDGVINGGMVI